uniref:Protochlorophyllide reductase n=1 Tax=Diacronema lutheri TaxID=2081491 RepID=A0A7R9ULP5_DIALT|mmetsp:Transcript_15993/g.49828  ORF Transcript_15993/g.49828 Transcript_15993/m.49828 type:complete len:428 (+) Transcript_15993:106-1389(+)
MAFHALGATVPVGGGPAGGDADARTPAWLASADLTGRVAIVTGPTSGLGEETALQLAARGATVVLACRDVAKGAALAERIGADARHTRKAQGAARAHVLPLDLADPPSVLAFARAFDERFGVLDILVNNAGVSTVLRDGKPLLSRALDGRLGIEATFLVNHLSHFALTLLLLPAFGRRGPGAPAGRIVHVASRAHRRMPASSAASAGARALDELHAEPSYGWLEASRAAAWLADPAKLRTSAQLMERYALSKLAQLSFALALDAALDAALRPDDPAERAEHDADVDVAVSARASRAALRARLNGRVIRSCAVHPGIVGTGILRESYNAVGPAAALALGLLVRLRAAFVGLDVPAGALPQLWCAAAAAVDERNVRGAYAVPAPLADGGVALRTPEHALAADPQFGERVWALSEVLWQQAVSGTSPSVA